MDRSDIAMLVEWAGLAGVEQRLVPAATVVLHDCLRLHHLPCQLEFRSLVLSLRLLPVHLDAYGIEGSDIKCAATIAGIRVADGLFNARGLDPWEDASKHADRSVYYLRWAKETVPGYLGMEQVELARRRWGSPIATAVCRLALQQGTPPAHGGKAPVRI